MGTLFVRFAVEDDIFWGVMEEGQVYKVSSDMSLKQFLQTKPYETATKEKIEGNLVICSPVTRDSQLYCQGANYSTHREEVGLNAEKPPFNLFFTKASSSLTSATSSIICPPHVALLDYEIELGLVMKQEITKSIEVEESTLADYVAGLVIMNDVSARDVQMLEGQWFKGKSYRTFAPAGPYFYLLDETEIHYLNDLEIVLKVNDEVRQQANTNQLLFKPAETISEFSQLLDLYPGDVILTGTTGGVGLTIDGVTRRILQDGSISFEEKQRQFIANQQKSPHYLQPNDVIEASIYSKDQHIHLGTQRNRIVMAGQEE